LSDRDSSGLAVYKQQAAFAGIRLDMLSAGLRASVARGYVSWQRVEVGGEPQLIVGVPLGLPGRLTGIEAYSMRSLLPEQQRIDELALVAWLIGGASLLLALVLAFLAARGVLRPVRDLNIAAYWLGQGDLSTRVPVRGRDELAGVASTFNHTAEALERQVGELRRMEADARRFVADVSHELRTPLAAMTAVADVLDEEAAAMPGDAARAARLVSQETRNLTRLVNDLIEVNRFDAGSAVLAPDTVDVAGAVTATLRARGWLDEVEAELPQGIQAHVDRRRLDMVVANLVGNAFMHGSPPVSLRLSAEPGWITIAVRDHGPGLDPQVLPRVFDRFYKADTARARSEGSGLGLAIAWENARLHHGTLVAANHPDGGAVFTLRLPAGGTQ
jgi:two-component system sensor histidine kinase MtrB